MLSVSRRPKVKKSKAIFSSIFPKRLHASRIILTSRSISLLSFKRLLLSLLTGSSFYLSRIKALSGGLFCLRLATRHRLNLAPLFELLKGVLSSSLDQDIVMIKLELLLSVGIRLYDEIGRL